MSALDQVMKFFNGHMVMELYIRWTGIEYICRRGCPGCAKKYPFPEYFLDYPICVQ